MSPTPFPGLLMSDAPKSLAQLCHLQDSALAFLPSPRREGPLQACCALSGGVPYPASYPSRPPGDEDTSQLLTVRSSDQSRVLTTLASPTSPPQPFCSLKGCAGVNFLRILQKLFFLKTDPVFVALVLHSYRCSPSPGGRRGCRNPWCFTMLLW